MISQSSHCHLITGRKDELDDEIYSSQLLEHLDGCADKDFSGVAVTGQDATTEAAEPRDLANLKLVFVVCLYLGKLMKDVF